MSIIKATPTGFSPQTLSIPAMVTVRWYNQDAMPRNVTFTVGPFNKHHGDLPLPLTALPAGMAFTCPGVYPFHDTVTGHLGTIRVY
jgi:hypothetical protein